MIVNFENLFVIMFEMIKMIRGFIAKDGVKWKIEGELSNAYLLNPLTFIHIKIILGIIKYCWFSILKLYYNN